MRNLARLTPDPRDPTVVAWQQQGLVFELSFSHQVYLGNLVQRELAANSSVLLAKHNPQDFGETFPEPEKKG